MLQWYLAYGDWSLSSPKNAKTSKEAWEKLQNVHQPRGAMRQGLLLKQLVRMEMRSSQDISEYINEFNKIVERLEETGIEFPKRLSGLFLLNSLPSEYETICVAIESREVFPSLEELKIKLIEEQMRIKDKFTENRSESEEALVATKKDVQQSKRKTYPSIVNKYKGKDRKCYICGKIGHFARNCKQSDKRNPTRNNQNEAMLSIALNTVAHSTSSWCLDSGATRHISNDKNKFVNLDTNNTPIYTATEDCTQASGSGVVKFETLGLKNEGVWDQNGFSPREKVGPMDVAARSSTLGGDASLRENST
ncbi:hypothetical protein M0802_013665 [Mischocyttarus mexicanus]|nr:hypothetical protein M0802_013665 [Mischocyttarus mexicanus]